MKAVKQGMKLKTTLREKKVLSELAKCRVSKLQEV
jgi:hypothetical protein